VRLIPRCTTAAQCRSCHGIHWGYTCITPARWPADAAQAQAARPVAGNTDAL